MWNRGLALFTLSMLSFACGGPGGSNKTAVSPSASMSPSHVSLGADITGSAPLEVSGPAFAKLDPENHLLVIVLFDSATDPPPTCAFVDPGGAMNMNSGALVSFQVQDFADAKAGSYSVAGVAFAKGDRAKGDAAMGGGSAPEGSKLQISQIDASTLAADIPDPKTGKSFASIHATMCKPGSLLPPGAKAASRGAAAGVDSSSAHELNDIDITLPDGKHQETAGPGAIVKVDPKAKVMGIYVWDEIFEPAPTCEAFGDAAKNAQQGSLVYIGFEKFPARKTGKFPVGGGQFFTTGLDPSQEIFGAGMFDATTIEITQFDDGAFVGRITSASDAKTKVTGRIMANVCPDGPIVFPSQKGKDKPKPKASSKKK